MSVALFVVATTIAVTLIMALAMKRFGVPPYLDRRAVRVAISGGLLAFATWTMFFR